MDSLLKPVGPEPAAVYWRRRALVVGGVLLVLIGLVMLWPSGSGTEPTAAADSASPSPAASSPLPSASPSVAASASVAASVSAVPSPTSTPACSDADVLIETSVATPDPKVGAPVTVEMTIANTSSGPCTRDVGAAQNEFLITSGGYRVWSSDDCSPGGPSQVETIPPGQAFAVQATWPAVITSPGCPQPQNPAQAGTYDVQGSNGDLAGSTARFTLTQ